jgi:hypothetical protein
LREAIWTEGNGRQPLLVQLQGLHVPSLAVKYLFSFILEGLFLPLQPKDTGADLLFSLPGAIKLAVGLFNLRVEFRPLYVADG